jgi:WD40 repeat protein
MVRLWSVETGSCHHIFTIRGGITGGVVYLFNGTQLACGSESGTLQFWDVESGESRGSVELSRGDVRMIAWKTSSDGVYVATGGIDGSVRLYQLTEKGDQYNARLCWSSSPKQLTITGASLQEVQGLSTSNKLLVHQHGAVGEI